MVLLGSSDTHKELVRTWIPKLRQVLERDMSAQLDRLGIKKGSPLEPLENLNLPSEAKEIRHRLEALLRRESTSEGTPERGYDTLLRDLTYTFLNRLVGLKAMEARGLLALSPPGSPSAPLEVTEVITPVPGQERSRYLRDLRAASGAEYRYAPDAEEKLLREGLTAAFRHITAEIRLLFDPDHEMACLWPTHPCLATAIGMINQDLPEAVFRAPDFLGWVYQFFNGKEKDRVKAESNGTPRSSFELAITNQFYTPTWIVKVLVDNTLGRLWLQMHPDSSLRGSLEAEESLGGESASYLVPRTGEKIPYRRVTGEGQVESFKLVREIALLDPACGTMHFGQYAFGLFVRMYEEEIEHAGEPGWPSEASVASRREIPLAIIEHNLFGVDIDPRAVQIASLSLMLTAKEAARRLGLDPQDVRLRRTNLVVANVVDLGKARLIAFARRVGERLDRGTHAGARSAGSDLAGRLFATIWDNLARVGELGSLVQVREGVQAALRDWARQEARRRGLLSAMPEPAFQARLFDEEEARQLVLERQLLEEEADRILDELVAAVEEASEQPGSDPEEHLFAEDTVRGVKLLRMLARRYDVVVMNPPYGAFVPSTKDYIRANYPKTSSDIYAAFIERAAQLTEPQGYVGALVSSTFKTNSRLEKLRKELLLKRNPLLLMLDLGPGILDDATVEAAGLVIQGSAP